MHLPCFGKPKTNTNYYSFYFQKELQPCIGNMHASLRRSHTQDLHCTCSIYLRDFRYPKDDAALFYPKQLFTMHLSAGTCFALIQGTTINNLHPINRSSNAMRIKLKRTQLCVIY